VPELPEVESVRRRLAPVLEGRRLERVEIADARLSRPFDPNLVARELEGERVVAVDRRGKYLIVRFESGRALLIHLRMTGSLRRFRTGLLLEPEELEPYLAARVGPEPLDPGFGAEELAARLARRTAPVKAAILDQRTVAGVGNIYADEALWRARIHPLREAGGLDAAEIQELV
jgi:formamidopyrimidine-DNA glycosylase